MLGIVIIFFLDPQEVLQEFLPIAACGGHALAHLQARNHQGSFLNSVLLTVGLEVARFFSPCGLCRGEYIHGE